MAVHVTLDPEMQGDSWEWEFTIAPEDDGDTLPDLTQCVITCTIGGTPGWTGSTSTTGVTVTDAPGGVVTVAVPPGDTEDFAAGHYNGDLQVRVAANGNTRTPVTFRLPVRSDYST